jgi:hypothetical protein
MAANNNQPSGWTGWIVFAGFMMILTGVLQGIAGLTALLNNKWLVVTQDHLIAFNFTTWGWIHLFIGVIVFAAGFAVMNGAVWARIIGVVIAMISIVANLAYANTYPVWAIVAITIDILVIYALTVRGNEVRG